ncbi:hypothetical protein CVS42_10575 [Aeromonas veronii]|uniref:hypothetical protein n=1 Tax=Aeromonas veronii TaxID=654 RepID=UPI000C28835C|nr:hypothetical protein [Aeromonas veronii]ATY81227.1 hypothetical protein CVS42_10575 [Aeromonas veronii]
MTSRELLEQAVHSSAIIHQPHALKAYLSVHFLAAHLGQPEALWQQTAKLIAKDGLQVSTVLTDSVQPVAFSDLRRHRILARGIYPAAYQAVSQWHAEYGFHDIFEFYIAKAARKPEYLSHNVTILLALNEIYNILPPEWVPAFLNRVTEFVTATFPNEENRERCEAITTGQPATLEDVLHSCLQQPGFFGHNLITLAWIVRCKTSLSDAQYNAMLSNLYLQAVEPLEDPDDELDLNLWNSCATHHESDGFIEQIRALVFDSSFNLHQITLADALCFLQQQYPEHTNELTRVAKYHTKKCAGMSS